MITICALLSIMDSAYCSKSHDRFDSGNNIT